MPRSNRSGGGGTGRRPGALVDRDSRRFAELGLAHAQLSAERWLERLVEEPLLLRMPLVRAQQRLSIGAAEADWRAWLAR